MKKHSRFVILAGLLLSVSALILAALLACKHSGLCVASFGCKIDGVDGCAELGRSVYSNIHIPFTKKGIAIAWFGFFYYALLALLFLRLFLGVQRQAKSKLGLGLLCGLAVFGFVFDLFLAYRNFFTLITPCRLCAYTYICQLGILFSASWLYFSLPSKRPKAQTDTFITLCWSEMKASRLSWGGAFVLTLVLFIIFSLSGNGKGDASLEQVRGVLPMNKVSSTLRELRSLKRRKLSLQGLSSYIGDEGAYIAIHEWIDFRCPHCRQGSELLKKIMRRWPGRIKLYVRYFPLDGRCNAHIKRRQADAASCKAAWASFCASKNKYYGQFVQQLFRFQTTQTHISYASLQDLTEQLGGTWSRIRSCMSSGAARVAITKDIQAAKKIDISATPTILLNGYQLPAGVPEKSWMIRTIDALVLEKEGEAALEDYQNRTSN